MSLHHGRVGQFMKYNLEVSGIMQMLECLGIIQHVPLRLPWALSLHITTERILDRVKMHSELTDWANCCCGSFCGGGVGKRTGLGCLRRRPPALRPCRSICTTYLHTRAILKEVQCK